MRRMMSFAYAAVNYTIMLGVFAYAAGFLSNMFVPKSIDSGEVGPMVPSLLINTLLLGLFAVQHTGMARRGFKKWWTKTVPAPIERATYVLATNLVLILMFWQWRPIPEVVWSVENPTGRAAIYASFLVGWAFLLVATFMIHHFDLFGMRQVWLPLRGRPYTELGFRTPGFYNYLRHPIQLGFLIVFWATPTMTVGHLMFSLATTGYIVIAVKFFEERDLARHFGDTYRNYMKQVPGFFPTGRSAGAHELEPVPSRAAGD